MREAWETRFREFIDSELVKMRNQQDNIHNEIAREYQVSVRDLYEMEFIYAEQNEHYDSPSRQQQDDQREQEMQDRDYWRDRM